MKGDFINVYSSYFYSTNFTNIHSFLTIWASFIKYNGEESVSLFFINKTSIDGGKFLTTTRKANCSDFFYKPCSNVNNKCNRQTTSECVNTVSTFLLTYRFIYENAFANVNILKWSEKTHKKQKLVKNTKNQQFSVTDIHLNKFLLNFNVSYIFPLIINTFCMWNLRFEVLKC